MWRNKQQNSQFESKISSPDWLDPPCAGRRDAALRRRVRQRRRWATSNPRSIFSPWTKMILGARRDGSANGSDAANAEKILTRKVANTRGSTLSDQLVEPYLILAFREKCTESPVPGLRHSWNRYRCGERLIRGVITSFSARIGLIRPDSA